MRLVLNQLLCGVSLVLAGGALPVSAVDGLSLLKVEAGARMAGMGGIGVSDSRHPDALFYNPAADQAGQFTIAAGHNTFWDRSALSNLSLSAPLSDRLNAIATVRYASIGEIEQRTIPSLEPEARFDAFDVAVKGGIGVGLTESVRFGVAAGLVMEKIDAWRGQAFSVDLGLTARIAPDYTIGLSAANLGSEFMLTNDRQIDSRAIAQPVTYRLGGNGRWGKLTVSIEGVVLDEQFHPHIGADYQLHPSFAFRAGGGFGYDSKSFGAGASFIRREISIDYAFVPYGNSLGSSHLFTLRFTLPN